MQDVTQEDCELCCWLLLLLGLAFVWRQKIVLPEGWADDDWFFTLEQLES
jgi:hypothetical protein